MTYTVYAFTNDRAKLCAGKTVTGSKEIADFAVKHYNSKGYKCTTEIEK